MSESITIRKLGKEDTESALRVVTEVFDKYEAPDYTEQGAQEFYKSIHDPDYLSQLIIYGAYDGEKLVGVIATRSGGTHVALFFVRGEYQRRGIGKMLFNTVLHKCGADRLTVNSSPFAVPVYHRLGFSDTDTEQTVNGIRFTPMELKVGQ